MKNQINTIRAALLHSKDAIIERGLNGNPEFADRWGLTLPLDRIAAALTALSELEAMAGKPVVEVENGVVVRSNVSPNFTGTLSYAAPPAQQYEAGDVASASAPGFRDGVASVTQQEPVAWQSIESMATQRYRVVPSHESMFYRHAVVAGDGTQQLYHGREVECENMARKFAGAFLDGAYAAQNYAAPVAQQPNFADAYQGAMGEVAIWKRRALEAEEVNRRFVAEINGPTHMGEPVAQQPQATCKTCGRRMDDPTVFHGPNGCFPNQQPQDEAYSKTELNAFVQDLYDRKMREGKHGHYETLFYCVHQAIKRVGPQSPPAWEHHARKLTRWLHCMSYNDSYFGEPAGLVKQVTGELNRLIGAAPQQAEAVPPDVVRDAERYRWLRDYIPEPTELEFLAVGRFDDFGAVAIEAADLDDAIDAAIAQQKGASHE